jgi:hypothetical protein
MKLKPECIPCLVERAKYECDIVFNEDREKIRALKEFTFVIRELIRMGKEVVVSPKSAPVINDATIEDLKEAGISYFEGRCKIIPSGAYIGISLGEVEEEFLDVFSDERYLVVAKGMGNYETISEFEARFGLKGRLKKF